MTDEPNSIVLDILKKVQDGQARLENGQVQIEQKMDRGFKETHDRLIAMDNYMAAFHTTQAYQSARAGLLQSCRSGSIASRNVSDCSIPRSTTRTVSRCVIHQHRP